VGVAVGAISTKPPRRFIESKLTPVDLAFGFGGGWGVERRTRRTRRGQRLEELAEIAAEMPPWPCASPRCKRMVRWDPKKTRGKFPRYCSARCSQSEYQRKHVARVRASQSRYYANLDPQKKIALSRRNDQRREEKSAARRLALAPLREQLNPHGISLAELARRLDISPPVVVNVFAGGMTSRRLVDTAWWRLEEPPIPPRARLSPEEKRARDPASSLARRRRLTSEQAERLLAYKREWRRESKRRRTPEQIARDLERARARWRRRTSEQIERARKQHQGRYRRLTEEDRARLRAYKRAWGRQRRAAAKAEHR